MDTSGGDDAELQMALMMSLQAEDDNGENANVVAAGKEKKPSAAVPLGQAAAENTGGDDCTPVGRDDEAAKEQPAAPAKKRRSDGSQAAAQAKPPKAPRLAEQPVTPADNLRRAVERRWGAYVQRLGPRELAAAAVDARRASGSAMSAAEAAACLRACRELLSTGEPDAALARLYSAEGAAQLEQLLQPQVAPPAAGAQEEDPRDYATSDAELGEEMMRQAAAAAPPAAAAGDPKPDSAAVPPVQTAKKKKKKKKKLTYKQMMKEMMAPTMTAEERKEQQKQRLLKSMPGTNTDHEHRLEKI